MFSEVGKVFERPVLVVERIDSCHEATGLTIEQKARLALMGLLE
jgi:hypothetical protein